MSFDRLSSIYDQTRALPPWVIDAVVGRILATTYPPPGAHILDLGVGTGRFAVPLLERGLRVTGVDIAESMMARLRARVGETDRLELVQADITHLPFPSASFDVVLTVHVFHLIDDWECALDEARRVLKPGGWLVAGSDQSVAGGPARDIRDRWRALVAERGVALRPQYGRFDAVLDQITRQGGRSAVYTPAYWTSPIVPGDLIDRFHAREYSHTWNVPDEVLDQVHDALQRWSLARYGSLELALPSAWEFNLSVTAAWEPKS